MAVTLYRRVGKGKARRYQKVNLGRGCRPGPVFAAILARDAAIRCDDGWAVAHRASVATYLVKLTLIFRNGLLHWYECVVGALGTAR